MLEFDGSQYTNENVLHVFLYEKFSQENEPQKPQNLRKMLRKSSVSVLELQFLKTMIFPRAL